MITDVFFDFFGTLVDYDPAVHPGSRNAPHEYAQRAGSAVTPAESSVLWQRAWDELETVAVARGREYSMRDIVRRFDELLGETEAPETAADQLIHDYLEAWSERMTPAKGALQSVTELARSYRLAVVSNTHDADLVPGLMRRFGFDAHIPDVLTSVELGWRKPDPHIFHAAQALHGAVPEQCVFVGDNWVADIEGAALAGFIPVYVGPPGEGRKSIRLSQLANLVRDLAAKSNWCNVAPCAQLFST